MNLSSNKKIAIISLCIDDWGGSEELWAKSIPYLQKEGYSFTVYKDKINYQHPEIKNLINTGVAFTELLPKKSLTEKIIYKAKRTYERIGNKINLVDFHWNELPHLFKKQLLATNPGFVIIAQGINFDGLVYAHECLKLKIPYSIISQKAVTFFWPQSSDRKYMSETLLNATKCYFVSHQNKQLTEEQFGIELPNAEVVSNPIKTSREIIPYPDTSNGFKLACVGRLFIIDKGQDILLRVLSIPKWRERPIEVSFIGSGHDEEGIKSLAKLLHLRNVEFKGHIKDIGNMWKDYHALILPSRSEGMALSVLEAMAAGRTVIVTNAGGHKEIIKHGENGFIAEANEKDLDAVMEEAWLKRNEWARIGKNANEYIKNHLPNSPEKEFSLSLLKTINEK